MTRSPDDETNSPDGIVNSCAAESNSPDGIVNSPDAEVNFLDGMVFSPDAEVNFLDETVFSPDAMAFDKDEMADNTLTDDGAAAETPTSGGQVPAAHPPPDIKFFQNVALRDWKWLYTTAAADTITAAISLYVYLRNLVNFTPILTHRYNRTSLRISTVNLCQYIKSTSS
jgi:hypothetical protein